MALLPNVNQMLEKRQLKLLHTQRRHLRSKVSSILSAWQNNAPTSPIYDSFGHDLRWVQHSGGGAPAQQYVWDNTYYMCTEVLQLDPTTSAANHFQSSLFYPLSERCAVRLGMRAGPTAEEAESRALGACLSLLPSTADWRRACRAWDSDLFEELVRTAAALDTALLFSLDHGERGRGQDSGSVVTTISCALPAWCAAEVRRGAGGDSGASTVVCVARETAPSLRDALKLAMVAATTALSARVETEWRQRARDAARCCHAAVTGSEAARPLEDAALFASLPGGTAAWQQHGTRRGDAAVRWQVRAGPHEDEVTVQLPSLHNPSSPFTWCGAVPHIPPVRRRTPVPRGCAGPLQLRRSETYGWPRAVLPFIAITLLAEKLSRVGLYAALRCPSLWQPAHSVEEFLFQMEAEGGTPATTLTAALTVVSRGKPSEPFAPALLGALLPEGGPRGPRTAAALRWTLAPLCLLPRSPLFLVLAQGGERPRWAGAPHPHRHFLQGVLRGCLAAFLASDAVVRGDGTSTAGEVALTATSAALGLSLPLYTYAGGNCSGCALQRYVVERCVFSMPGDVQAGTAALSPPLSEPVSLSRRHEVATVPDVLALLDEVRRARDLPSVSFPVIAFAQKARHDPARRFQELRAGLHGDVDIYTRVTLRWEEAEPGWSAKAVSDPELHHHHYHHNSRTTASPPFSRASCYALRDTGEPRGPLPLLVAVVLALHRRVFPARGRSLPQLEVRHPASRRGLDFLLYTWFSAPPQIRTFDILSAAGWQQEAERGEAGLLGGAADGTVRHAVDKTMVRAMLFYDLLGQRVLFAETHAREAARAVSRVEWRGVAQNLRLASGGEHFDQKGDEGTPADATTPAAAAAAAALRPFRAISFMQLSEKERRHLQHLCAPPADATAVFPYARVCDHLLAGRSRPHLSELGALVALLEAAELHDTAVRFTFVQSVPPQPSDGAVEGVLTLRVAGRPVEAARVSSQVSDPVGGEEEGVGACAWSGVVPAAVHLVQRALGRALDDRGDAAAHAALCRACEQCRTVLGRDGYPPYSATFYHPPHLLGVVLQGVAGKYECTYEHIRSEKAGEKEEAVPVLPRRTEAASHLLSASGPRTTFFAAEREEVRGRPDWVAPLHIECRLTIASLVGCPSDAADGDGGAPFLLGRGVGRSRREAWVAAARQALKCNFPALHAQLGAFQQLSEWRMDPIALELLGAPHGLRLQWSAASSSSCAMRIFAAAAATTTPASPPPPPPLELAASTVAPDAETGFVEAVRQLGQRLRQTRQTWREGKGGATATLPYAAWTPESHYAKSLWHGLCGGISASMGGSRVRLYFEMTELNSAAATTAAVMSSPPLPFATVHVVQHLVLPGARDGVFRPVRRPLLSLTCAEVADYLGAHGPAADGPAALLLCALPAALHALFVGSAPAPPVPGELQRLLLLHAREVARTCRQSRHLSTLQQAHALLVACTGCRTDVTVVTDQDGWRAEAWLQLPCYVDAQADAQWRRVLVAAHTGRTSDRAVAALWKELVAEAERLGVVLSTLSQNTI